MMISMVFSRQFIYETYALYMGSRPVRTFTSGVMQLIHHLKLIDEVAFSFNEPVT